MASCERTGGVMGPVANSDSLPSRVSFNHDAEAKIVGPRSKRDAQPSVVEMVEEAAAHGDVAAMERIVNRARWNMGDEAPAAPEPVIDKPRYNY